jgi:hypothetical protein
MHSETSASPCSREHKNSNIYNYVENFDQYSYGLWRRTYLHNIGIPLS